MTLAIRPALAKGGPGQTTSDAWVVQADLAREALQNRIWLLFNQSLKLVVRESRIGHLFLV